VVEIDTASGATLGVRSNPRRPCILLELDCTPFGHKTKHGVAAFNASAVKLIRESGPPPEAVVELRLRGRLNLNRIALDTETAAAEIGEEANVFAVSIDPTGLNIELSGAAVMGDEDGISREDLERAAIRGLVDEEPLWGLDDKRPEFAAFFYELKETVRTKVGAEALAEQIVHTPLTQQILKQQGKASEEAVKAEDQGDAEPVKAPTDEVPAE
jgi:hypothetical protein